MVGVSIIVAGRDILLDQRSCLVDAAVSEVRLEDFPERVTVGRAAVELLGSLNRFGDARIFVEEDV